MLNSTKGHKLLLAATTGGLTVLPGAAVAQIADDPISNCREASSNQSERIDCLESALTELMESLRQSNYKDGGALAQSIAQDPDQPMPPAPSEQLATSTAPTLAPATKKQDTKVAEGLGAEQVRARITKNKPINERQSDKNEVIASITDIAYAHQGELILFLDNGQVWRQIKGDNQRIKLSADDGYSARVWSSRFGGYKLKIQERNRTIRVRRIR